MGGRVKKNQKKKLDVTLFLAAVHVVFLTSLFMLLFHCKALGVFTCGLECVVLWFCSCSQQGGGSTGLPPVITALMYCHYDCSCCRYYIVAGLADGSRVLSPRIGIIWIALVYVYDGKCTCVCERVCPCAGTRAGDRGRFVKCERCLELVPTTLCWSLRGSEGHCDLINEGSSLPQMLILSFAFLFVSVSRADTCSAPNRILRWGDACDIVGVDFGGV